MSPTTNINPTGFTIVYEPLGEPVVDIVLVHGLGGHPRRTWTFAAGGRKAISAHMEPLSEQKANHQKNRILRLFSHKDNDGDANVQLAQTVRLPSPGPSSEGHKSMPSISSTGSAQAGGSHLPGTFLTPEATVPTGHGQNSAGSGDVYWPTELLPIETPNARILVWGYESLGSRDISTDERATLRLHARDLLFSLHKERAPSRPLLWLAHSLGGLIVKETLRRSQFTGEPELHDIFNSTKGVLFLGTPHRLSLGYATFGDQILSIASTIMQVSTTHPQLLALGLNTAETEASRQSFLQQWDSRNFVVKTFQESRVSLAPYGAFMSNKTVPDDSSSFNDPRERCEQLQADHRSLAQYRGPKDPNFQKVSAELKRIIGLYGSSNTFSEKEITCMRSFWFSDIQRREKSILSPLEGTAEWLTESHEFKNWFSRTDINASGFLWLQGGPGTGKSTVMLKTWSKITAIDGQVNSLLFCFDASGSKLQRTSNGLWQSLIYQLCHQDKNILAGLLKRYLHRVRQTLDGDWTWSLSELEEFMNEIIAMKLRKTCIFIDAIDECDEATLSGLFSSLSILELAAAQKGIILNICLSSQSDPPELLEGCSKILMTKNNNDDLMRYVNHHFLLVTQNEPQALTLMTKELQNRAEGNFLWATLATEYLLFELEAGNPLYLVIESIDVIPQALESIFKDLSQSIKPEAKLLSVRLLQWILYSGKEFTPAQLWMAILFSIQTPSVEEMMKAWGFVGDTVPTPTHLMENIKAASRGMVEGTVNGVKYTHETVRKFFLHGPGLGFVDADLKDDSFGKSSLVLANACLSILDAPSSLQESGCHWVLMQYAQKHFIIHAKNAESRNVSTRPLLARLENPSSRLWKLLKPSPNTPLLYFLCLHHLGSSALALLERGQSLRDLTYFPDFQIPLLGCLTHKQDREPFSLALALLKHGSPANIINEQGNTPLHLALRWNYANIVDMLLNRYNAPLNEANNEGDYPIHVCAKFGDSKLLDMILKRIPDLNLRNLAGATPLHIAAGFGNFVTVNDLLVYGADATILDTDRHDALLHAIRGATKNTKLICETLIAYGASLKTTDGHGRTPLHHACRSSFLATVRLLADNGADVNAVDMHGETCLHMAAQRGAFDIIQDLLNRGADTSIKNVQNFTPLELGLQFRKNMEQGNVLLEIFRTSDVTSHILKAGSDKVYSWEPGDENVFRR